MLFDKEISFTTQDTVNEQSVLNWWHLQISLRLFSPKDWKFKGNR